MTTGILDYGQSTLVVPYMTLYLINEVHWERFVEDRGPRLPSGIVEVTSPITAMKETYFLSFNTKTPSAPVDHHILEKLIHCSVKDMLSTVWSQQSKGRVDIAHLIEELTWKALFTRLDIMVYEFTLSKGRPVFELMPGIWVSYKETYKKSEVSRYVGTLLVDNTVYHAHLFSINTIGIQELGPDYQVKALIEERANRHFKTNVTFTPSQDDTHH